LTTATMTTKTWKVEENATSTTLTTTMALTSTTNKRKMLVDHGHRAAYSLSMVAVVVSTIVSMTM
jgi:hypothetical protein